MRAAAAALLAGGVFALGGCGGSGSSGVAPAKYVTSICTSLESWKSALSSASQKLQASAAKTTSLAGGKQEYVSFVGALVTATSQAATELKVAGIPAVGDGKQIASSLVQAFTHASAALQQAAAHAGAIPVTNASAFQAAASGVTAEVKQSLSGMADITPRHDATLRTAAQKAVACQALEAAA
jgi:hypothetical protein